MAKHVFTQQRVAGGSHSRYVRRVRTLAGPTVCALGPAEQYTVGPANIDSVPPHAPNETGHSLSIIDGMLLRISMLAVRKSQSAGPTEATGTLGPANTS